MSKFGIIFPVELHEGNFPGFLSVHNVVSVALSRVYNSVLNTIIYSWFNNISIILALRP